MVQRCLDGDSQFGVVLIKMGSDVGEPAEPYSVGTVAKILQVQRLDGGRMLISVQGEERFRIAEITQAHPYIEGEVEVLDEDTEPDISPSELEGIQKAASRNLSLIPNPSKDTDGRREDSGRGWVRELQGRWSGVLG